MYLSLGDVISLSTTFAARSDFATSEASKLANIALTEVNNRLHHKPKEAKALSNITGTGSERDLVIVDTVVLDSKSSISGLPERYALYGNTIELDPIPNSRGSLVLRYVAKQQTLILSTATPDLDERWHQGWLWKTAELVALSRSDKQTAADFERRYVNYMVSTPNDRTTEQQAKHGLGLWVRKS
jgi:hypothetical protein